MKTKRDEFHYEKEEPRNKPKGSKRMSRVEKSNRKYKRWSQYDDL